jgi:hypothetical protein
MAEHKQPLVSVNIPEWDGAPREALEAWTLTKGQHTARCSFVTHPKGGECRLTIDGEWYRGSVAVDGRTLLDLAFDWRDSFVAKGWK